MSLNVLQRELIETVPAVTCCLCLSGDCHACTYIMWTVLMNGSSEIGYVLCVEFELMHMHIRLIESHQQIIHEYAMVGIINRCLETWELCLLFHICI